MLLGALPVWVSFFLSPAGRERPGKGQCSLKLHLWSPPKQKTLWSSVIPTYSVKGAWGKGALTSCVEAPAGSEELWGETQLPLCSLLFAPVPSSSLVQTLPTQCGKCLPLELHSIIKTSGSKMNPWIKESFNHSGQNLTHRDIWWHWIKWLNWF